jgi:hypothetical protein
MAKKRFEYSPKWAPHVVALIDEPEVDEAGLRDEQKIDARCGKCGEPFHRTCSSGLVRGHVDRFATFHLHRDPLAAPIKPPEVKPG